MCDLRERLADADDVQGRKAEEAAKAEASQADADPATAASEAGDAAGTRPAPGAEGTTPEVEGSKGAVEAK